jgi:hypothetical protein
VKKELMKEKKMRMGRRGSNRREVNKPIYGL